MWTILSVLGIGTVTLLLVTVLWYPLELFIRCCIATVIMLTGFAFLTGIMTVGLHVLGLWLGI